MDVEGGDDDDTCIYMSFGLKEQKLLYKTSV